MAKKVLILSSSPRKGGNSDTLCNNFMKGAQDAGHEVEKIFLKDKKINYCVGCGYCANSGYNGCAQIDDMTDVLKKMIEADVIVMATPVYFYTMSAQMKTLIDRCCAVYTKIKNKSFFFIMTAADGNKAALERTKDGFMGFLDCLDNPKDLGAIYAAGLWEKDDVKKTDYPNEAYNFGYNL